MAWQISRTGRLDRLIVFRAQDDGHVPVGQLLFEGAGTIRQCRFTYARSWMAHADKLPLDPIGLPLSRTEVIVRAGEVPLAIYDVGPDSWGRRVLTAAFPEMTLGMAEFLALGSLQRTGDLAFGPDPMGPPMTWQPDAAAVLTLPRDDDDLEALQDAAMAIDAGQAQATHFQKIWRSASDVGGARPKARLRFEGREWLAKFSSRDDDFDEPAVESACLDLAARAGLDVPGHRLVSVAGRRVLLLERFDRGPGGRKFGYLSAGTLVQEAHDAYTTRKTYADIADVAKRIGVHAAEATIYRHMLVNACLHNTDDHLRNLAFIRVDGRWRVAPGFDLVPQQRKAHVLAPAPGMSTAWNIRDYAGAYRLFGLREQDARQVYEEVIAAMQEAAGILAAYLPTATECGRILALMAQGREPLFPDWAQIRSR